MIDQVGAATYDTHRGDERMTAGVVVRHLMLPGISTIRCASCGFLHERFGSALRMSLMNQYTPVLLSAAQRGTSVRLGSCGLAPNSVSG